MEYAQGNGGLKFLQISRVSRLGECEVKFVDAFVKPQVQTKAMKTGVKMHEELTEGLPKVSKEDVIKQISEGRKFGVRELFVTDNRYSIRGRIDSLEMTGNVVDGRNEGIIVDDKYTRMEYDSIPLQYKLQLAAYASAIRNSAEYGSICSIIGARLICRVSGTHEIIKEFEAGRAELASWVYNMPIAAKVAWVLYKGERKPRHMRLDIGTGEWGVCGCGHNGF